MFSVSINEKKKAVKGPQKPMAVLVPTPHQEKEHQQKSRGQEKPRVGQVWTAAVSPVRYALRVGEEKAPFCQKRSRKKWKGGKGK